MIVKNYNDFVSVLHEAGFSMGGGNSEGIYAVIPFQWDEKPPFDTPIKWHTGDPETDPWEWRMRVLDEQNDIAYAKVFFRKSGYITKAWYPYFLAARRGTISLQDEYWNGTISKYAMNVYQVISEHGSLPLHVLKQMVGVGKEEKSLFERTLVDLQMKMYITMCGHQQKVSQMGLEYGWYSTVFCTTESFFGDEVFDVAAKISESDAIRSISDRINKLNPHADPKKILKFIRG